MYFYADMVFVCASWGCFWLRAACNALGISSPGQAHFDSPMCLLFHFLFFCHRRTYAYNLAPPFALVWTFLGHMQDFDDDFGAGCPIFVRSSQKATSWAWTTVFLVPGPVLGIALIAALRMSPDAAKMSNGKG